MLIECPICMIHIEVEVLHEFSRENPYDFIDAYNYTFSKCPKCETPLLIEQEREVDDIEHNLYWGEPKLIYPNYDFYINPIIPEKLRQSLAESIKCYKTKAYTATTIMCRRTIEGFCHLRGIKENNLASAIKKLKTNGVINEQLFKWANELRLIGNEAAHNIDLHFSSIDARDTLDFTIAILDFTYSFKDKFDKFKQRISKQKDKNKQNN